VPARNSLKRLTIRDVAKVAGVSTQTVSRVINNHPDVAADTLTRVQTVIKDLGYAPDILARSLIRGRSHTLGIVAFGLEFYGPSRVLTGIERQAAELGYSISLNLVHRPELADAKTLLASLQARRVDGVIWAIPEIGDNRARAREISAAAALPLVFVNGDPTVVGAPLIGIDNLAIGRLATEHLLALGARQVGVVAGPNDWWEAQQRLAGWRQALTACGLSADETLVAVGDWGAESGRLAGQSLLERHPKLDAIFAGNDQMALGVMYAAHALGRRIPDDLAVVGVDNIPEAALFWPPLTSMRQRLREAGAQAVRLVDSLIGESGDSPDAPVVTPTLLQPELIVRTSTRGA